MELELILYLLLLGTFVGFMAGTLGIGGGAILVPILTSIFLSQGTSPDVVLHLVFGTSMATIIFTSISSMRAHNSKKSVIWDIVKLVSPGILIGTFLATFLVSKLNTGYLVLFFSVFMAYVAIQMFTNIIPKTKRELDGKVGLFFVGSSIGSLSALVCIGGGMLSVPYLLWNNIDIKKAIGTSAAMGFPISIGATAGYLVNGWHNTSFDDLILGYIHLPAVAIISIASFLMAPFGAKLAHKLPVQTLRKIFGILVSILCIKMLILFL